MGMFGGLEQDNYDRQYDDGYLLKRMATYFTPYKGKLLIVVIGFIVAAILSALPPIWVADGVEVIDTSEGADQVMLIIGALFVAAVLQYAANWVRRYLMSQVIGTVIAQLRKDAFHAALARDMAFYDTQKSGKIVSRITSDTQEFGEIVMIASDVIAQLIQVFILLFVLVERSVTLTLLLIAMLPFIALTAMSFRRLARVVTRQGSRAMAMVNDTIQETVTGISVAKNFRKEGMIYQEFNAINTQSYDINLRRGFVLALIFPALNILAGFAIALIMYVGGLYVLWGWVSVASWFLFVQGVDRFWFPFINISVIWSQFQQALSATERIFALIDAENTVKQIDNQPSGAVQGKIEIDDVTFGYSAEHPILKHFNLSIASGKSVAFVGHTGAGKSTIAKLITRFYEFQAGQIRIDGKDIRTFDLKTFRRKLGIVPQQPFLFSGTVRDNIRYSRPEATDAEINEVAYSVGNGEWLQGMPNGLDTDVGERGAHLSMGQRQLVALMRVLLERPAIFILDEATASVDPFTEAQIQEALDLILQKSTSILIAHRLSTIRNADRIIVLKEGAIIEEGSHEQLMDAGGHYAELYNTYFRHQSLSYIENAKSMFDE